MTPFEATTGAFAGLALASAATAAFSSDTRKALLALWAAGLFCGALFLTAGAELLAILQWIVSTVCALGSMFFVVVYNERGQKQSGRFWREVVRAIPATLAAGAFTGALWLGIRLLSAEAPVNPVEGGNLASIGIALADKHLVSLEVLAITFLLGLVGAGTLSRSTERGGS